MYEQDFEKPIDDMISRIVNKIDFESIEDSELIFLIENEVFSYDEYDEKDFSDKNKIVQDIFNVMRGYDILEPLISDESVTEIMCNGHDRIFIERNGKLEKVNLKFSDKERYNNLLQKIASDINRKVDFMNPIVDARLKNGSRVNIVLDPVAINGPILTIRKFSSKLFSIDDLIGFGSFSESCGYFLKKMVMEKKNIFISGGTGSGKTTLLNALCNEISFDERIITIEDSAEIKIEGIDNYISLEKRNKNMEGKGEITISDLIKTSLRMRPDRIVVGEIRGGEALDMLQAMNTGHDGSISTGHSNSAIDMISRIETMVISNFEIPIASVKRQISSAIDIIVHLSRMRDGSRKIIEIFKVKGFKEDEIELKKLFEYSYDKKILLEVGDFYD